MESNTTGSHPTRKPRSFWSVIIPDPVKDLILDEALADEIRGRQVLAVKRMTPIMLLANVIAIFATSYVLFGSVDGSLLAGWVAFAATVAFGGLVGIKFRWRIKSKAYPRKSTSNILTSSLLLALIWAALPLLFYADAPTSEKVFIASVTAGMMGGGTIALNVIPVAAWAFCWTVGLGAIGAVFVSPDTTMIGVGLLLITYATALTRAASEHGRRYVRSFIDEKSMLSQQETISMLLKDFQDSSSDWMWETNTEGQIISPSKRFCESFGDQHEQLEGRKFSSLVTLPQAKGSSEQSSAPLNKKLMTALIFREHNVQIDTAAGPVWWSLTGKPVVDELGNLTGFRGTASDIQKTKHAQEKLNSMALEDQLTKLSNRNYFYETLEESCWKLEEAGNGNGCDFYLLYLDIDSFKAVNDSLGHAKGDAILREVANRLQICLGDQDTVSRFGGDEFAIILRPQAGDDAGEEMAEKIITRMARPFLIQGHTVSLTCSIGLVDFSSTQGNAERVMSNADLALSQAKAAGGGTYRLFEAEMNQTMLRRREFEVELRTALKEKQFTVHYQPVVSMRTKKVACYEALVRWNHPVRGELHAAEFITFAEEVGLIGELSGWVLEQACHDASQWYEPCRVSVNVASEQIKSQSMLMKLITIFAETGLAGERLELEFQEEVLNENPERTLKLFSDLKALGIHLSCDDFGMGKSSLSALVDFPFDKVKIHGDYVRDAEESEKSLLLVRSIIGLAKNLGIVTVAKGVETNAQGKLMAAEGCDEIQGFYYGKPQPLEQIELTRASVKQPAA